jgi:hypothetical protein
VARAARDEGVGSSLTDAELPGAVRGAMWDPQYPELIPA